MAVGESMLAILAIPAKHGVGLIEGRKMIALRIKVATLQ
jgi:hypothetical protein